MSTKPGNLPEEVEKACGTFDFSRGRLRELSRALLAEVRRMIQLESIEAAKSERGREEASEEFILSECERRYARRELECPGCRAVERGEEQECATHATWIAPPPHEGNAGVYIEPKLHQVQEVGVPSWLKRKVRPWPQRVDLATLPARELIERARVLAPFNGPELFHLSERASESFELALEALESVSRMPRTSEEELGAKAWLVDASTMELVRRALAAMDGKREEGLKGPDAAGR